MIQCTKEAVLVLSSSLYKYPKYLLFTFASGFNMAINVDVQYNGGFLPDIMLLTLCYYHYWGTRLNAMKRFCLSSI